MTPAEQMRERAARAAEECVCAAPNAIWSAAQEGIAEDIRALPLPEEAAPKVRVDERGYVDDYRDGYMLTLGRAQDGDWIVSVRRVEETCSRAAVIVALSGGAKNAGKVGIALKALWNALGSDDTRDEEGTVQDG